MRGESLRGLRQEGERFSWHRQYIKNSLAALGQIHTQDKKLAGHILDAEQALRKALAYVGADPSTRTEE